MSETITFSIAGGPEALAFKEKIRDEAMSRGVSMSEYIVEAIADHMRKERHAVQA